MTDLNPAPPPERPSGAGPVPWVISLALAAVVGAVLFVGGYLAGGGTSSSGCAAPDEAFAAFCEAYARIQDDYVDDLDPDKLAEGAIRGMFQYGVEDPYSGYMPPEQYQQALGDLSGSFGGIGAEMAMTNTEDPADLASCTAFNDTCRLVVVAPLDDTPADRAGLQSGDHVLAVDGESVEGSTVNDQVTKIRGEPGTEVTLTIQRDGGEPFDLTITRAEIVLQEVETRMIDDHIGYIALNGFSAPASEQFAAGLASSSTRAPTSSSSTCATTRADTSTRRSRSPASSWTTASSSRRSRPTTTSGATSRPATGSPPIRTCRWSSSSTAARHRPRRSSPPRSRSAAAQRWSASRRSARTRSRSGAGSRTTAACGSRSAAGSRPSTTASRRTASSPTSTPPAPSETPPEEDPILDAALAFLEDQPVADGESGSLAPAPSAAVAAARGGRHCGATAHLLASPATKGGGVADG